LGADHPVCAKRPFYGFWQGPIGQSALCFSLGGSCRFLTFSDSVYARARLNGNLELSRRIDIVRHSRRGQILSLRMSKTFRAWKIDEPLFLPPTVQDFVAEDHLARFVLSLVRDDLGLAEITGTYGSERGQPPFDPTMMTALLLYSYCCGIYSSRRIAKACGFHEHCGARCTGFPHHLGFPQATLEGA
jgi:Transposase domain (DUF772)